MLTLFTQITYSKVRNVMQHKTLLMFDAGYGYKLVGMILGAG